jgi:hypothetical protein
LGWSCREWMTMRRMMLSLRVSMKRSGIDA